MWDNWLQHMNKEFNLQYKMATGNSAYQVLKNHLFKEETPTPEELAKKSKTTKNTKS